jgi:hypothetical protein
VGKKPAGKSTSTRTVASKPEARAVGKPAPAKAAPVRPVAAKPAAKPSVGKPRAKKSAAPAIPDTPIKHISPEEALAHIQALLEAKQERVRQGPSWPGAEAAQHPAPAAADVHAPPAGAGAGCPARRPSATRWHTSVAIRPSARGDACANMAAG